MAQSGDKVMDQYLKRFDGTIAKYRDCRRSWQIYHAGQSDKNRALTGVRILGSLDGEAARLFKNRDPNDYRGKTQFISIADEDGEDANGAGKGKGKSRSEPVYDDSAFH